MAIPLGLPYLTGLWALPAVLGCAVGARAARSPRDSLGPKHLALGGALLVMLYTAALLVPYRLGTGVWRLGETMNASAYGITYALGLDGVSWTLCALNALLILAALASSWKLAVPPAYWAAFLFLESAVMGVFLARDLFYFFVFWEASLIPMFFIIGLWGGEKRRLAALKFILYTVFGSVFLLVGTLALVTFHHRETGVWTWSLSALGRPALPIPAARWIFLAMGLGFAVKVPLFPLHSWLPDAHTEAPAAGSVILAGVLLKMGVYGFYRVLIPLFPVLSKEFAPWLCAWGAFNVLYGALCAMAQTDLKRLIAYTSISHLGFCVLGLFSLTALGISGGNLQMINHGLSTGALFLLVGMLYERTHRRGVGEFGGLAVRAPWLAFFFGFVMLSSIGLPGLNGFVGEFMSLAGLAQVRPSLAAAGLLGAILAAAYFLPAYQQVFWAPAGPGSASEGVADLDRRERLILWVFAALILGIGLFPGPLLRLLAPSVGALLPSLP